MLFAKLVIISNYSSPYEAALGLIKASVIYHAYLAVVWICLNYSLRSPRFSCQ